MSETTRSWTRRTFLTTAAATTLGARQVLAAEELRVGLIGCGGRGTGAVKDILQADTQIRLVALGDVFENQIASCLKNLYGPSFAQVKARVDVPKERQFVGFNAFEKVIASGVDIVLLATPSAFRPAHLEAAIAANKHVFAEKAVAVDSPGVRKVLKLADDADRKGLSVVVGYQRRYQEEYQEFVKRLRDGVIGDVTRGQCSWGSTGIWFRTREQAWSDMEFQLRNWFHFLWASGDVVVEWLSHNLDVSNWVLGAHPLRANGRCSRNPAGSLPAAGDIRDSFDITFSYPKGVAVTAEAWLDKTKKSKVGEAFTGSKGSANASGSSLTFTVGERTDRVTEGKTSPYLAEMQALCTAIRRGKPANDLRWAADTALTGILGRMAAYTGKEVTWEQAFASTEDLMPKLQFGPVATTTTTKPVEVTTAQGLYAVLVGVNAYDHEKLPPLKYAVNDASALAGVLEKAGYKVILLTDDVGKRDPKLAPTKANIERSLKAVLDGAKKGETVLVALAGHGLQFEGDKDSYFCPADARPFKDKAESLVSLGAVYRDLDASFAGVKVLLVDACRDDPAAGRGSRGVDADSAPPPPRGVAALFSCSAGQRAFEHDKLKHGLFFHHVLEGLGGRAKDSDGEVTFNALSDYVAKRVKADAANLIGEGAKQLPNQKGDFAGGSPVLVKGKP